jgi:OmpA-OmpF porin, OOP family
VATDKDGKFLLFEVTPPDKEKPVKVEVTKDGFETQSHDVPVKADQTAKSDFELVAEVKKGAFDILTMSKKKPVLATVSFAGAAENAVTMEDSSTPKHVEMPAGEYVVTVNADGFLSQTKAVQISPNATMALNFELVPSPKKVLVTLKGDKLEIAQQVHFATNKAVILADSYSLLQQVVDAVVKNNVKRLRVEGHTDNRGVKARNQTLSEERAKAVADYLAAQGIDKTRLESVGYGDEKPVAPNLTARGRELNRRVELIVIEK